MCQLTDPKMHFLSEQIKPAVIVDKLIEAVVDVLVPGKGAGESNW